MDEKFISLCLMFALAGGAALVGCDDEDDVDDVDTGEADAAEDAAPGDDADAVDGPAVEEVACEEVEADVTISMIDFDYEPSSQTIEAGQTVEWTNDGAVPHSTTSGEPGGDAVGEVWDSGNMAPGDSFCARFEAAETYDYFCTFHPQQMQATLTVE